MRILTRYILREVTSHALIGAAIFTFVLFTRDLGRILELVVRASAPLPSVAEIFFYTVPLALVLVLLTLFGALPMYNRVAAMSAKCKCSTPKHDADHRDRERHEEGQPKHAERDGKGRKQAGDHEDQPDVVRLPHRTHRLSDGIALLTGARPAGEQVPDTSTEVSAREHRICGQSKPEDASDELRATHRHRRRRREFERPARAGASRS